MTSTSERLRITEERIPPRPPTWSRLRTDRDPAVVGDEDGRGAEDAGDDAREVPLGGDREDDEDDDGVLGPREAAVALDEPLVEERTAR